MELKVRPHSLLNSKINEGKWSDSGWCKQSGQAGWATQPVWALGRTEKCVTSTGLLHRRLLSVLSIRLCFGLPILSFLLQNRVDTEWRERRILISQQTLLRLTREQQTLHLSVDWRVFSAPFAVDHGILAHSIYPPTLCSLPSILYGRWREVNICFVPDLTSYRTPTSYILLCFHSCPVTFAYLFLSFLYNLIFSPGQKFLVVGQWDRSGCPWRERFVSDY